MNLLKWAEGSLILWSSIQTDSKAVLPFRITCKQMLKYWSNHLNILIKSYDINIFITIFILLIK